jgi:altronate hydrolase
LLAENKPLWIDFNAGAVLDGVYVEDIDKAFVEYIIDVASGKDTNNETASYSEIAIFKSGVTL